MEGVCLVEAELSWEKKDLLTRERPSFLGKNFNRTKDQKEDPTPVVMELLYLLRKKQICSFRCEVTSETKYVKHAVAIALAQKNKGSLEAESIVRAASTRVRFRLSTTPFYSGVRGVEV
ncbi:hypothetical protein Tco_0600590 [Tanacetum coccineum]